MTTTEPMRRVVCSGCGDPLDEYSAVIRHRTGPCCSGSSEPWNDDHEDCDCGDFACTECMDRVMDNGGLDHFDREALRDYDEPTWREYCENWGHDDEVYDWHVDQGELDSWERRELFENDPARYEQYAHEHGFEDELEEFQQGAREQ